MNVLQGGGGAISLGRGGKGAFDCQNCAFTGNKANNGLVGTTSIKCMHIITAFTLVSRKCV